MGSGGARGWYEKGVGEHYRRAGAGYSNPHAPIVDVALRKAISRWNLNLTDVLDLAAGAGEVSRTVLHLRGSVLGVDPYTGLAYQRAIGQPCLPLTFADVAAGALSGRQFTLIVCSFAMHLCEPSRLPGLCLALRELSDRLLILTPHKRPLIAADWGWGLQDEFTEQRVRVRVYGRVQPR